MCRVPVTLGGGSRMLYGVPVPQGQVAYTHLGPVKPDKFRSVITKLL